MERLSGIDFGPGVVPTGSLTVDSCGITGVNTQINFVPDDPGLTCRISKVVLYDVTTSPDALVVAATLDHALETYELGHRSTFVGGSYARHIAEGEDWIAEIHAGVPGESMSLGFFRPGPTNLSAIDYRPLTALDTIVEQNGDSIAALQTLVRTSTAPFVMVAEWNVEYFDNSVTGTD